MSEEMPKEIHVHRIIADGESYLKAYYEPSSLDRLGTRYTRLDPDDIVISRKELEGMLIVTWEDAEDFAVATARNKIINELLARIK